MDPQVIVKVPRDEIIHEGADGGTVLVVLVFLPHVGGSELGLCLSFEVWLLDLDADSPYDALTAVLGLIVLFEIILESLGYRLPERCQMSASVPGILAIDERRDVLAVGVAVGKDYLDVVILEVDRLVQRGLGHILLHKVEETVL